MKRIFLFAFLCSLSFGFISFKGPRIGEDATRENFNNVIETSKDLSNSFEDVYDCGVGCTATATNSITGESRSFYTYVIASNCATAQSLSCGTSYAKALNWINMQ